MTTPSQLTFAGGEIAPSVYGRIDQVKYSTGLRTCRNFIVQRHGGAANRPGTEFIVETKHSAKASRLIKFVFNSSQTYILEFGDRYIRFIRNQAPITVSGVAAYNGGTSYVVGDLVSSVGINYYCIAATTGNAPPNVTYWYPLTGDIYEIPTPYVEADLFDLRFAQSADVITIVHPSYAARDLSRTGHTTWTLAAVTFAPTQAAPTGVAIAGGAGANSYTYHVTAYDTETGEESLAATGTQGSLAAPTTSAPHTVTWVAASGADEYNIYLVENGVAGFIGTAIGVSFSNDGIEPEFSDTPPVARNPFSGSGSYPSTVTYYQQRLIFANTNNNPEGVWASRSGLRKNFTISSPLQDDDAVTFRMTGNQVNEVEHLADAGMLIAFTSGGEWSIGGDEAGILKPTAVNPKQHTFNGSGRLGPINVGGNLLYVQARGSIVRDLAFEIQSEGYRGNDLTIFAAHLFDGYTLVDWAYQQTPHSVVWCVRSDGTMLGLTYIREQQVWGWHRHDFENGAVESVATIPEGTEDYLYLVINRTIDGSTKRYIERMATRKIDDIIEYVGMDSALTYDGRHTGSTTMTLTSGGGWDYDDTLTLTASVVGTFAAGDVGNEIHLTGSAGDVIRCSIVSYVGTQVVGVKPNKTVPVSMRSVAIATWARAVDVVTGLSHLEGEDVSIFADGFVIGSPNNAACTTFTVSSGVVTLDRCYAVITVGLPITSDIQLLDIDTTQGETLMDKRKNVGKVTMLIEGSRGLWVGNEPPTDDATDPLEGLTELKIRETEGYNDPVSLSTDVVDVLIRPEWNSNGRVFIRQVDPIPLTILRVSPSGYIPFRT